MMKGALHQLLGSSAEAAQLREQFVFKVGCSACDDNPNAVLGSIFGCHVHLCPCPNG